MPLKNDTLSANTANQIVQSISLTVRISLLVIQINGLEYLDDIITENRWMFSAKLENRGSHYNPLLLPAKFSFVKISPGEILWMRIFTQQNFSKTKFHFSGCKISTRWQWNFSWLKANSQVHTKFCRIFARTMDKIHQILLSFLLHSTVSTVFHKPHSSSNVNVKINVSPVLNRVWQIFRCTFMNGSNNGGSWTYGHHCQRKEISCQVGLWTFFRIILSVITCWI